jgi:antitoxin component HigA of HigAB toxin-antitoxin module
MPNLTQQLREARAKAEKPLRLNNRDVMYDSTEYRELLLKHGSELLDRLEQAEREAMDSADTLMFIIEAYEDGHYGEEDFVSKVKNVANALDTYNKSVKDL